MELLFPHTFAPRNESFIDGTFAPRDFHFRSQSNVVSLPNTNYDYLIDKLMVLRRYGLVVSLYSFVVKMKDGRFWQIIILIILS